MKNKTYRIKELAEALGVSRRTIHYYLARGLLPPSEGSGLGTSYTEEHYYRILLIKKWQKAFYPLEEIRKRLNGLTLKEVMGYLEKEETIPRVQKIEDAPLPGSTWQRITLMRGLELHCQAENPMVIRLAEELLGWFQNQKKEG